MEHTASEQHGQTAPPAEAAMAAEGLAIANPTTPAPPPPQGLPSPPTATSGAAAAGVAPPSLRGGGKDGGTHWSQPLPGNPVAPIVSASLPPTTATPHNAAPALGTHGQQPTQPAGPPPPAAPAPLAAAAAAPAIAMPNPFPHPGPPGGRASPPSPAMAAALAQQADPAACTLETGGLASPAGKLRVQIFRVNHRDPLRLDEEDRALQETLRPLTFQEWEQKVVIESVGAVSFSAIRQHMDRFKPHCVHFMGHGTEERLVLVDDGGQSRRYGAAEIATLFSTQPQCFLAVFNCCLSAPIARAVCEQGGVFATIGTSTKIGDSVALAFAKAMWTGVLLKPLGAAFTQARLSRPYHLFQGRNPPSPPTQRSPPSAQPAPAAHLPPLKARLREQYTSAAFTKIRILDYEANTAIQLEEIYTRLAIVDAQAQQVREAGQKEIVSRADLAVEFDTLYNPKQPSHIDHLFGKPGEPTSKRVLALGRAGIGKTTLSRKIAHLWATGHAPLTSRFDLVFRIALREEIDDVGSIEELLHAECLGSSDDASVADLRATLQQAKPRVLLLLDGYDEFRSDGCKLVKRLIEGKLNPGFSVLITSRPAAAQQLMRSGSQHPFFTFDNVFELLGFSTAAITEYVGKYFAAKPDTATGMVAYLEAHPTVQGAARVPIVAALLCILYESHEERGAEEAGELPSTLTGIFQGMVEYLLGRARLRLELKGDGDDEARLQAGLEFLEALAWEGMQQGRILFSREQFEAFSKPPHSVERATLELALELGFLTTAESRRANERVARVEYHFLHLTLQEFLAARHLQRTRRLRGARRRGSLLSLHSKVKVFEDRQSLRMVWQFGCGLLGADAGDLLRTIVQKAKARLLRRRRRDKRRALLALQCQAESGCPELVGLLKDVFKDGRIDLGNTQLSAVELAAVVDVIKRFKIRVLDLSGNSGLGVSDANVLGPALRGERAPEEVCVGGCGIGFIAQLWHLFPGVSIIATAEEMLVARAWLPGQATLDLSQQGLGPGASTVLADLLNGNTTLSALDLHDNNLRSEGGTAIAEAIKGNTTLTTLDLHDTELGSEGGAALAEALKGNTTLTSLDLDNNDLGPEAGVALAEALKGNTTLTSLDLSDNKLGPEGGVALGEALKGNTALTTIDLGSNNLGPEAGVALAEALQGNATLTTLDLRYNALGPEGGAALGGALKGNTALATLHLGWNDLREKGGAALAEVLKGNPALTSLDLHGSSLGPAGAMAVAEALKGNTALTTLNLSFNELGSKGGAALAEALKGNIALTSLNLGHNELGAEGGAALAEALRRSTTLTTLDLSFNKFGPEGGARLAGALKSNSALTTLNLSWNHLGPKGGAALAEALKGNTTLASLNLGANNLAPDVEAAVAELLKDNAPSPASTSARLSSDGAPCA